MLSGLQHLGLESNKLGTAGMEALAKALPQVSALQHLDLRENGLGAAGMEALAKALPQLSGMEWRSRTTSGIMLVSICIFLSSEWRCSARERRLMRSQS